MAEEFGNIPSPNAGDLGVISRRQGWNLVAICERKSVRSKPGGRGSEVQEMETQTGFCLALFCELGKQWEESSCCGDEHN